jgi:hypothetical protein
LSLVRFHRFLIACAIVVCAAYAAWEWRTNLPRGGLGAGLRCAAAAAAAVCLAVYLRHFIARTRRGS